MTKKPIVALVAPNQFRYSETFIRAHEERLGADVRLLYGGFAPQFSKKYGPLTGQSFWAKAFRNIENWLTPKSRLTSHERALLHFLQREGAELVFAEYGIAGVRMWRVCRAAGLPMIVHFHGFDAFYYPTVRQYGAAYREMFQYASFIVGVSRHMCAQLKALGAPEEKVVYSTYGPRPEFLEVQPVFSEKTFVAVGRFTDKKAPHITIQAFAKAAEQFPDLRLRMGGDGENFEQCKALARSLGIADKIEFAGAISHEQVLDWFSKAYAFVQHSVRATNGDSEGTPVVVLEASAAGLPVISTRNAGIPDVIIEEETGLLVDEHDLEGFAQAMIRVAGDEQLAKRLGAAGKQNIRQHFTMERHIETLDALILKAIEGKPKA